MARATLPFARLTDLPPVCVCCGAAAARTRVQAFRLDNLRSAAVLTGSILAGGFAWTEREIRLTLPVCDSHRRQGRESNRTLLWGLVLTAALGGGAYLASLFGGPVSSYLAIGSAVTFMATLFAGMHQIDDGLKAKSLTADAVTLGGVHRAFADAVSANSRQPTG